MDACIHRKLGYATDIVLKASDCAQAGCLYDACGSLSGAADVSGLLGCDAETSGDQRPTFRRIVFIALSRVKQSSQLLFDLDDKGNKVFRNVGPQPTPPTAQQ